MPVVGNYGVGAGVYAEAVLYYVWCCISTAGVKLIGVEGQSVRTGS